MSDSVIYLHLKITDGLNKCSVAYPNFTLKPYFLQNEKHLTKILFEIIELGYYSRHIQYA